MLISIINWMIMALPSHLGLARSMGLWHQDVTMLSTGYDYF